MQKTSKIIRKIISIIITFFFIFSAYKIYSINNFNEYVKAEYNSGLSNFKRDEEVKYSNVNSYKIENTDYNDAMFFRKISVNPNTPYKVTCMVKTENVQNKDGDTDAGAHICINETVEKSDNIVGTTDWTKLEFVFNSKNKTELEIGFRLGGNNDDSIGTVWFSDMTIESGVSDESSTWNFLCILFDNVDVNVNIKGKSQNVKLHLTETDKEDMRICMQRFKNAMSELSKNKMHVTYDIVETQVPIHSMSHDEENGYYVSAYDVKDVLDEYINQGKYDHIFIAFRTGDINSKTEIPVNDWIGLGSMEYREIGFSNIRLPNSESNYIYKYDERINTFPEEVYVHEFLHTLERNAQEYGYERPELHAYEKYGYKNENTEGLKQWYKDYMNKEVKSSYGNYVGLPSEIYTKKPVKTSQFDYTVKLDKLKDPENIIEEIIEIFRKIESLFETIKINIQSIQNDA